MATSHLGRQTLLHLKSWVPGVRTSGNLFRKQTTSLYDSLSLTGDVVGAIKNSVTISRCFLGTNHHAQPALQKTENFLSATDGVNTAVQGVMLWGQLLNGSMIFETTDTGEFIRENANDTNNPLAQKLRRRSALTITGKVSRLAAKTLGTATFLHDMSVVSLGSHANRVGCQVSSCLNLAATSCSLVENSIALYQVLKNKPETMSDPENPSQPSREFLERSKNLRNCFIAWLGDMVDLVGDILSTVCSFLPAILGIHAVLIMAIIGLISSVINFIKDYAKIG
ncbi:hypothetical protein [Candidatus Chlamydia corallus]|uniref:hypothetical protein n=1 Tax=Candidatus Chlamydia corallus TaxID=2038470 RepID=UPI000C2F9D8A|nr:hypothetical protein [Candidatus Chlamydia corallus]